MVGAEPRPGRSGQQEIDPAGEPGGLLGEGHVVTDEWSDADASKRQDRRCYGARREGGTFSGPKVPLGIDLPVASWPHEEERILNRTVRPHVWQTDGDERIEAAGPPLCPPSRVSVAGFGQCGVVERRVVAGQCELRKQHDVGGERAKKTVVPLSRRSGTAPDRRGLNDGGGTPVHDLNHTPPAQPDLAPCGFEEPMRCQSAGRACARRCLRGPLPALDRSEPRYHGWVPQIRVLSDQLVNRIAAGEVVERPASVIKELIENSLDAGANRIRIELKAGGRSLIRVSDDGVGMDADDALLALERHATSKIARPEDLGRIMTLGFRGEAIPSIAAVSRFELVTCSDPAEGGCRVTVEGGRILGVDGVARPRGTTVTVRELFFNVPARRKFLRSPETELRHAQDVVTAAALARPDVGFELSHGGRSLLELPPASDPASRFVALGRQSGSPSRFEERAGSVRVWGFVEPGRGAGRPALTFLVNGRAVRDRLLVGAVMRVLRERGGGLTGGRVAIFVEVPPGDVDVNVHPAKTEVRFARSGTVFAAVERAVRQGLTASHGHVDVGRLEPLAPMPERERRRAAASGASDATLASAPLFDHPVYGSAEPWEAPARPAHVEEATRPFGLAQGARPGAPDTPFGRLIGQYRSSFLLLEDEEGLVIVDQHVAHERVLYDRIRKRLAGSTAPSQRLLTPVLLTLDEARAGALGRVVPLLERAGIEADLFAKDTVRISALPPECSPGAGEETVERLLDRATSLDGVPERVAEELEEELAASLSCRAAIKVNHPLTPAAQRSLLNDLAASDDPYRCPHGRPIILRLSEVEIERRLGRR